MGVDFKGILEEELPASNVRIMMSSMKEWGSGSGSNQPLGLGHLCRSIQSYSRPIFWHDNASAKKPLGIFEGSKE